MRLLPNNELKNVVYGLTDPRTGVIRYVGKTARKVRYRYRVHVGQARAGLKTHKCNWIRELLALDLEPGLAILGHGVDDEVLCALEIGWIAFLRALGVKLTNGTDGGEGTPNPSEEVRAKLRARPRPGPLTEEQRQRRRESSKRMWQDKEYRQAQREAQATYNVPFPHRKGEEFTQWQTANAKRMGAMNRGAIRSPEVRAQIAATLRGRPTGRAGSVHTPETRAKLRNTWAGKSRELLRCECGAGPYKGPRALATHKTMEAKDQPPTMCECGAGPFVGEMGLRSHRTRKHKAA